MLGFYFLKCFCTFHIPLYSVNLTPLIFYLLDYLNLLSLNQEQTQFFQHTHSDYFINLISKCISIYYFTHYINVMWVPTLLGWFSFCFCVWMNYADFNVLGPYLCSLTLTLKWTLERTLYKQFFFVCLFCSQCCRLMLFTLAVLYWMEQRWCSLRIVFLSS